MVEKTITLESIQLIDFLGVENENIKEISAAFPDSKIISRGNEIKIQGNGAQIVKINEILGALLHHYKKYGKVTKENVQSYLNDNRNQVIDGENQGILLYGTKGAKIYPRTPNQKKLVDNVKKHDLVFAIGPAGTGKTYISVAMAVRALKNKEIKKIIITRPAVEAGENLGFLPGDLKEKLDPYLRPIYDALDEMIPAEKLKYYFENRVIEIAPLAYMRGRTLNNAFVLLDEAQNTTPMQLKMFLTRLGPESKMIITGDLSQIDLPKRQKSGLEESATVLKNVRGIGFVWLEAKDVVRHKIVRSVIKAYEDYDKKQEAEA